MARIQKILVFRLSSIGDIVLTTCLLRCLRKTYPDAQIDFVVKKQFADILNCVQYVSHVITLDAQKGFSELRSLRNALKETHYDVVLDIHNNWRSLYLCNTIGAEKVYHFNKHVFRRWMLTTFHKDIYKEVRPVYLRFTDAAAAIDVYPDGAYTDLRVPNSIQEHVDTMLTESGILLNKTIITLCPGASFSNKQWPSEKFTELAIQLTNNGHQVMLLGGKKEMDICACIAEKTGAINFAGKFNLSQSIAAIRRGRVTVSNDTGMLHVSEALGIPVVGIYGPTARQFGYFPILPQSRVAQVSNLPCRPCTKMGMNHCPKGHFKCMTDIRVDAVHALVKQILQTTND